MKKTVRRKITILLIMSMIMQLFLGVTPVMAENSGDLKPEPEFVPLSGEPFTGEIASDGTYQLPVDFTGSITIGSAAASVAEEMAQEAP